MRSQGKRTDRVPTVRVQSARRDKNLLALALARTVLRDVGTGPEGLLLPSRVKLPKPPSEQRPRVRPDRAAGTARLMDMVPVEGPRVALRNLAGLMVVRDPIGGRDRKDREVVDRIVDVDRKVGIVAPIMDADHKDREVAGVREIVDRTVDADRKDREAVAGLEIVDPDRKDQEVVAGLEIVDVDHRDREVVADREIVDRAVVARGAMVRVVVILPVEDQVRIRGIIRSLLM